MVITQNLKPGVYRESYRKAIPDEISASSTKYKSSKKEYLIKRNGHLIYYLGYRSGPHLLDVVGGEIGFDSEESEEDVLNQFDRWVSGKFVLPDREPKPKNVKLTKEEKFQKRLRSLSQLHRKPITEKDINVTVYSRSNSYLVRYYCGFNREQNQAFIGYAKDNNGIDKLKKWALPFINEEIKRRSTEL